MVKKTLEEWNETWEILLEKELSEDNRLKNLFHFSDEELEFVKNTKFLSGSWDEGNEFSGTSFFELAIKGMDGEIFIIGGEYPGDMYITHKVFSKEGNKRFLDLLLSFPMDEMLDDITEYNKGE